MALLDRVGYVARRHPQLLRRKVGAAIVVARRAGQNFTFAQLNYFFLISEMIVPGSTYWNVAFGREKGEVRNDAEGMETVKTLARNMAWLMKRLAAPAAAGASVARRAFAENRFHDRVAHEIETGRS